jgi:hypothetical protein
MGFDFLPFWPSLAGPQPAASQSQRVAAGAFRFLTLIEVFDEPLIDQICDKNSGGYQDH